KAPLRAGIRSLPRCFNARQSTTNNGNIIHQRRDQIANQKSKISLAPLLSTFGFFVRILHYLCDSISFRLRGHTSLFLFGHFLMMLFKFKPAHPQRRNSDAFEVAPLFSHWSFFHDRFPFLVAWTLVCDS